MGSTFIQRHGLWSAEQQDQADKIAAQVTEQGLRQVRVAWGDQHGILRGKTLEAGHFLSVLRNGKDFQTATLIFDTTNNPAVPPFAADGFGDPRMTGLPPDGVLVPDPGTFRILPWLDKTGWVLCNLHYRSGEVVPPFDTRGILQSQLSQLKDEGWNFVAGIELEFYITKLEDPRLSFEQSGYPPDPPQVSAVSHGFQYLTENRGDEITPILDILRDNVVALGLPLATVEDEWGPPGQTEFTFEVMEGLQAADSAILLRSAIKQLCRRNGHHATFMSRPALPNAFSSGWHLHQSLGNTEVENAFAGTADEVLSDTGRHWMAGLLEHARSCSVLSTPDRQRLQALPAGLVRPGPHRVGRGEPRRADPRRRWSWRLEHPPGEPRRRAGREPVPVPGLPGHLGPRRSAQQARPGPPLGRRAVPGRGRAPAGLPRGVDRALQEEQPAALRAR